jgi:Tol biopolymer transport system component
MIPSLLLTVLAAATAGCALARDQPAPAERFLLPIPAELTLASFAMSPDGASVAFSAESRTDGVRRIFITPVGSGGDRLRELPETAGGSNPFFSPDGLTVAYFSRGAIWRVPASGNSRPQRLVDAPADSAGGTWTSDGRIVFAPLGNTGLVQVSADRGTPEPLTTLDVGEELEHGWPHALPDGAVIFTVSEQGRDPHVEVVSTGKARTRLRVPIAGQAQFVESGHLVYSYLGNLMAVRFDSGEKKIVGVPIPITKGVQTVSGFGTLGRSTMSVSRSGTLAWLRATAGDPSSRLVRVDRNGRSTPMSSPTEVYQTPRLSPNGRRLAVVVRAAMMTREIRVLELARPDRVLFRVEGGDNQSPAWMDDRRLSFGSNRDGPQKIYSVTAEGKGRPRPLFTIDVTAARNPASWSRPPRLLALY